MERTEEIRPYDVVVVGAGAAGMMAAGTAAQRGCRVLLLEKMEKSGRKVRITGKGRCNVTNARPAEEFAAQVRTNAAFFAPAFAAFNNRAAIRFFERQGVRLDIERGERVFPHSGKAWDIANALLGFCVDNGVKILYDTRVTGIMTLGGRVFGVKYVNKRGFERKEECPQVILATGGVSYPATGSTGDGYAFAADLGHTIEPLRPSLTPLVSSHPRVRQLDRLLLRNVRATLWIDDAPVREEFGELGFSERGIEGAVALRMSRDAVDALIDQRRVKLVVDLKPALTEEVLRERIAREIADMEPTEFFTELLRKLVPKPLVLTLVHEMDVNGKNYVSKITEEQIGRLPVVDRLEEAAAARGLLFEGRLLAVVESRDAAHDLAAAVARHPADRLAVGEQLVARRVEDLLDVLIQRADPVAVTFVYPFGQVEPLAHQRRRRDLLQDVFLLIHRLRFCLFRFQR